MKILFIGDIYGDPGIDYLLENITYLRQTYQPNLIIANAENSANGRGINKKIYKKLMQAGISLLTMGNHTWKNPELKTFIEDSNIIRPINDGSNLGSGYKIMNYNGQKVLVINALGKAFMNEDYEPPFIMVKEVLDREIYDYALLDFHAETTSEKIAMAYFLDGKVDMMVGTHTHIQTNDDRLLDNGTLYLTDVGMTGPLEGVIGVKKEIIIDRFIHGQSRPNEVALGRRQLNACLFTLSPTKKIEKIHLEETHKLV
ncbi:TIGR00282 family metallophosphoesterase [Acholeplasma laidlawii]|jgi:metallophosphoesterase (TIGR00282 family)|uniref:TIGR00282 family metallophosphoesterase n=1 Tax=Acholeplasma laidlawii TaxID=2148 RepID=UPI0018C265D9|nr:TIGR00282 family metallophosphoesterase [Acholeplasma laidlawii]MBG0763047.1 TIGR00282 family metallophosphoesterase [Acholeplasma laidlawii]